MRFDTRSGISARDVFVAHVYPLNQESRLACTTHLAARIRHMSANPCTLPAAPVSVRAGLPRLRELRPITTSVRSACHPERVTSRTVPGIPEFRTNIRPSRYATSTHSPLAHAELLRQDKARCSIEYKIPSHLAMRREGSRARAERTCTGSFHRPDKWLVALSVNADRADANA